VAWSLLAVERLVLQRLRDARVRMLVIDELHNVLAGRSDKRREFLNLIRFLGNRLRIPLVGVGTREAYLAIRSHDQLENRFEPFVLPRWQAGEEACSLLASFAASFPLRRESRIATRDMGLRSRPQRGHDRRACLPADRRRRRCDRVRRGSDHSPDAADGPVRRPDRAAPAVRAGTGMRAARRNMKRCLSC